MEFLIKTDSIGGLTEEQFFHFCQENSLLRIERNSSGEIVILSPTGSQTGWFNSNVNLEVGLWNRANNLGYVFDSSTGFTLPNYAVKSADVAFIRKERWDLIAVDDRKRFAHICPDFVIEILSTSDNIDHLNAKMKEWMANGCSLAWLINPENKVTTVYTQKSSYEIPFNQLLSGEEILPGFTLNAADIFTEK